MRSRFESLELRRREILEHLVLIGELEKRGQVDPQARLRLASKLAHVDKAIFNLKQMRLPL